MVRLRLGVAKQAKGMQPPKSHWELSVVSSTGKLLPQRSKTVPSPILFSLAAERNRALPARLATPNLEARSGPIPKRVVARRVVEGLMTTLPLKMVMVPLAIAAMTLQKKTTESLRSLLVLCTCIGTHVFCCTCRRIPSK